MGQMQAELMFQKKAIAAVYLNYSTDCKGPSSYFKPTRFVSANMDVYIFASTTSWEIKGNNAFLTHISPLPNSFYSDNQVNVILMTSLGWTIITADPNNVFKNKWLRRPPHHQHHPSYNITGLGFTCISPFGMLVSSYGILRYISASLPHLSQLS